MNNRTVDNYNQKEKRLNFSQKKENTINSIVNTMTELTEINGIKILIENEENKSFKDEQIKFDEIFYKI